MTNLKQHFQHFTKGFGQGLVLTVIILASPVNAQQNSQESAPAIAPEANQLLQHLGQYIDQAQQLQHQLATKSTITILEHSMFSMQPQTIIISAI